MSVRSKDNLMEYIKDKKLQNKTAYYKAKRSSGNWYVLLYGNYENKAEAELGKQTVAKKLKIKAPLIRSFNVIQKDVKQSTQ